MLGHGLERFFPRLPRAFCGANDDLRVLDFELDFLTEAALLQEYLGYADPLGIADFDDARLHGSMNLLQVDRRDGYIVITVGRKSRGSLYQWEVREEHCQGIRGSVGPNASLEAPRKACQRFMRSPSKTLWLMCNHRVGCAILAVAHPRPVARDRADRR